MTVGTHGNDPAQPQMCFLKGRAKPGQGTRLENAEKMPVVTQKPGGGAAENMQGFGVAQGAFPQCQGRSPALARQAIRRVGQHHMARSVRYGQRQRQIRRLKEQALLQTQGARIAPGRLQQGRLTLQAQPARFGAAQSQPQQGRAAAATQLRNRQGPGFCPAEAGAAFLAVASRKGRQQQSVQAEAQCPGGLLQTPRESRASGADAFRLLSFPRHQGLIFTACRIMALSRLPCPTAMRRPN